MGFSPAHGVSRKARRPCKRPQSREGAPRGSEPALWYRQALVQGLPSALGALGWSPSLSCPGLRAATALGRGVGQPSRRGLSVPGPRRVVGNRRRSNCLLALLPKGEDRSAWSSEVPTTRDGGDGGLGLSTQSLPPAGRKGYQSRRGGRSSAGTGESLPAEETLARETKADFPHSKIRGILQEQNREIRAGRKVTCKLGKIRSPVSGLSFIPAAMTSLRLFLSRGLSGQRPSSLRS